MKFENKSEKKILNLAFVGRINRIKGLHILFEAINQIALKDKYCLHIFGEASTKPELKYKKLLLKKTHNINIIWHGKINKKDLDQEMSSIDLLILPSICLETFGLVVAEAFTHKIPVLSTKCGGPEDQIEDGINGFLIKANDSLAMSKKLIEVINNPKILKDLIQNISPPLLINEHIKKVDTLYNELIVQNKKEMSQ